MRPLRTPRSIQARTRRLAACALLLALLLIVLLVLRQLAPPPLPASFPCPPPGSSVLVHNAHYLTRGNVGHWGYALFALHTALASASSPLPPRLTLFFDARVSTGDWVRTAVAALSQRHGVALQLSPHAVGGRCGGGEGAPFAELDANDARGLDGGREEGLREAWREVCGVSEKGKAEVRRSRLASPRICARSRRARRTC